MACCSLGSWAGASGKSRPGIIAGLLPRHVHPISSFDVAILGGGGRGLQQRRVVARATGALDVAGGARAAAVRGVAWSGLPAGLGAGPTGPGAGRPGTELRRAGGSHAGHHRPPRQHGRVRPPTLRAPGRFSSPAASIQARALLVATGLRLLKALALLCGAPPARAGRQRADPATRHLPPGRVLLLGAGDNAAENALFLAEGFEVLVWARGNWRASAPDPAHRSPPRIQLRLATPCQTGCGRMTTASRSATSASTSSPRCWVFEPEPSAFGLFQRARPRIAFVAGDASGAGTLRADGAGRRRAGCQAHRAGPAARRSDRRAAALQQPPGHPPAGPALKANLGILDFERDGPQPIQVDAEVNLGALPIVARDADIGRVLDYRRIRRHHRRVHRRAHVTSSKPWWANSATA